MVDLLIPNSKGGNREKELDSSWRCRADAVRGRC